MAENTTASLTTGDTKVKNFMNYIKIDEVQNSRLLASAEFFKGKIHRIK